ncbi:putative inorganic phosphate cotransporter [Dendroctonus ponderosae]|uniref:putative inorganic phosphate cotransporter n=1 Tax=Dendroctonus ponderosae TaxID=77166 RepID=UPI0020365F01|nr:putative inorganic phosphate cotransporter [Dendroctonus ponderosae]
MQKAAAVSEMDENIERKQSFGIRHLMAVLLHTFLICISLTRVSMSLAIVAMTDINPDIPGVVCKVMLSEWRETLKARGSYIPMLVLIWLGFLTKQQTTLAVILLNIQAISAVKLFGSLINHVDLSPRYTGVLMGLENTLGQVIAMFAPIFNQLMVADLVSTPN